MDISQIIVDETLVADERAGGTPGGDIIQIAQLLKKLLDVHQSLADEESGYESNANLTTNILTTTDHLLLSSVGWQEISSNHTRYTTSSNLLASTDSSGFLLFNQSTLPNGTSYSEDVPHNYDGLELQYTYGGSGLTMNTVKHSTDTSNSPPSCHMFDKSEICVPKSIYDQLDLASVIKVAAQYKVDLNAGQFPSTVENHNFNSHKSNLNEYLIGLSLHNKTMPAVGDELIKITFHHGQTEVRTTFKVRSHSHIK